MTQMTTEGREIKDKDGKVQVVAWDVPNGMAISYGLRAKSLQGRTIIFRSLEEAEKISPKLIAPFMRLPGITRITMGTFENGYDYMTVTVNNRNVWDNIKTPLEGGLIPLSAVLNAQKIDDLVDFSQLKGVKTPKAFLDAFTAAGCPQWEAEMRSMIATVNMKLAAHGGETHFAGYDDATQTLSVWLEGNCNGCAASNLTMQAGLMNVFRASATFMAKKVEKLRVVDQKPQILRV